MREFGFVILAFVAAAFPPALFTAVYTAVVEPDIRRDVVAILALLGGFWAGTFFVALFCGGIPFVVLRSFNLVRWWSATVAGTLVGFGVVYALGTRHMDPGGIIGLVCSGAVSGFVFWLVWRKGHEPHAVPAA